MIRIHHGLYNGENTRHLLELVDLLASAPVGFRLLHLTPDRRMSYRKVGVDLIELTAGSLNSAFQQHQGSTLGKFGYDELYYEDTK